MRWIVLFLAGVAAAGSANAQLTIAPQAPLNSNATTDATTSNDAFSEVATDGAGNWVAVWRATDGLNGTTGLDAEVLFSRSTNNGATWSPIALLNTNGMTDSGSDTFPHVASEGAGVWVGVWRSTDTLGGTIGTDQDILFARSTNNGVTWSAPAALNANAATDTGADTEVRIAADGLGNWVAVWSSNDTLGGTVGADNDIFVARSSNGGVSWSAVAALNTNAASDSGSDETPDVYTDGAGNWIAVWSSDDTLGGTIGSDFDVLYAVSANNGASWSAPAALNTNAATDSGRDDVPIVKTDGAGVWVALWASLDSLGGTKGTDNDILVSRSVDDGASWSAPATIISAMLTDSGEDEDAPELATDTNGNWVALWHGDDPLAADLDVFYSLSSDDGATWNSVDFWIDAYQSADLGDDANPDLAADVNGNWVIVWSTDDSQGGTIGTDVDVMFTTFSTGNPNMPAAMPLALAVAALLVGLVAFLRLRRIG